MGAVWAWICTALGILVLSGVGAICLTIVFILWLAKEIVRAAERWL